MARTPGMRQSVTEDSAQKVARWVAAAEQQTTSATRLQVVGGEEVPPQQHQQLQLTLAQLQQLQPGQAATTGWILQVPDSSHLGCHEPRTSSLATGGALAASTLHLATGPGVPNSSSVHIPNHVIVATPAIGPAVLLGGQPPEGILAAPVVLQHPAAAGPPAGILLTQQQASEALLGQPRPTSSLYIKNLPGDATELFLYQWFAPHGAILSCRVRTDPVTGKCKGVGFVNYRDPSSATVAMHTLHGVRLPSGRKLRVTLQAPISTTAQGSSSLLPGTAAEVPTTTASDLPPQHGFHAHP